MKFPNQFIPTSFSTQWASSEARVRLALQAEGKLDKPVFGVHYDTPENKFDFESVNPDNPFNEDDDDGAILFLLITCAIQIYSINFVLLSN